VNPKQLQDFVTESMPPEAADPARNRAGKTPPRRSPAADGAVPGGGRRRPEWRLAAGLPGGGGDNA